MANWLTRLLVPNVLNPATHRARTLLWGVVTAAKTFILAAIVTAHLPAVVTIVMAVVTLLSVATTARHALLWRATAQARSHHQRPRPRPHTQRPSHPAGHR